MLEINELFELLQRYKNDPLIKSKKHTLIIIIKKNHEGITMQLRKIILIIEKII